jgi:putative endonuclease
MRIYLRESLRSSRISECGLWEKEAVQKVTTNNEPRTTNNKQPTTNKPMPSNQKIGRKGEDVAVRFLEEKGYRIMDRNYRFQRAEIDVVAFEPDDDDQGGELVFVEVKTRSSLAYGHPEESISEEKERAIRKVAGAWLHERRMEGAPCRFDVVSIVLNQGDTPTIDHYENAFFG